MSHNEVDPGPLWHPWFMQLTCLESPLFQIVTLICANRIARKEKGKEDNFLRLQYRTNLIELSEGKSSGNAT